MAVITGGAHPKELWPGVKKIFGNRYDEIPAVCDMIFEEFTSDKAYEEYVETTGFGLAAIKPEGAPISYDTDAQGYTTRLYNVTYALGAQVSEEAIADNQYFNVASDKAKKLARSMRITRETVFANVLNRAFSTSYLGGNGKPLLATDHPNLSGDQSNILSVSADLSEAALEDMLTQIRGATDSRGLRVQLKGQKLVIPPALEFEAKRILGSSLQSGTANNDLNAMKELGSLPGGTLVWDFLTDSDAWFVTTDADTGLIRQKRRGVSIDKDKDFDTSNAHFKASERYTPGWGDWRGVFGSAGA